jgi:hypothetical protein
VANKDRELKEMGGVGMKGVEGRIRNYVGWMRWNVWRVTVTRQAANRPYAQYIQGAFTFQHSYEETAFTR